MYCSKCGKQIDDSSKFCEYCGAAVAGVGNVQNTNVVYMPQQGTYQHVAPNNKKRHGFVTFCLYLMTGSCFLSVVLIFYLEAKGLDTTVFSEYSYWDRFVLLFSGICLIFLLNWKKFGFWGCCGLSAVQMCIGMAYDDALSFIGAIINVAILWGILQIKEDGVSCWDNLE